MVLRLNIIVPLRSDINNIKKQVFLILLFIVITIIEMFVMQNLTWKMVHMSITQKKNIPFMIPLQTMTMRQESQQVQPAQIILMTVAL